MSEALPASGGWQSGDDVGRRLFFTFADDRPFALDSGAVLTDVTIAYETWGELAPDASNAILVCHAWTGDSHAAGRAGRGHLAPGWWDALIGPGKAIDTNRWFVVCSNVQTRRTRTVVSILRAFYDVRWRSYRSPSTTVAS